MSLARRFSLGILIPLIAVCLSAGTTMPALAADARPDQPNILLIMVDDLGWGDLSSYGAPDLKSPNIDKLVAAGMRFDNFYANCCVCSPTRAALMTGRFQEFVGVPGVIRTHDHRNWGWLDPSVTTLPDALKRAGYHTALVGKWHLGLKSPNKPNERGFDHFHGFLGDMMDDYYHHRRHGNNYMRHNDETIDPEGHATDLFTQWAIDYLRDRAKRDGPFFLYLAYNAPHTPIQPPKDWFEKIKQREKGITDKRAKLVALIEHMDHGIGQVMAALAETGLAKDTLVIFTSDNGGKLSVGARNGPVRGGKTQVYEGGVRVATCAVWPGKIKPGSRTDFRAMTMDLYPTLTSAAGLEMKHIIEGRSILPTLLGKPQAAFDRDDVYTWLQGGTKEAMRRGDWKIVRDKPGGPFELYNLKDDPKEQNNLAEKAPEKHAELLKAIKTHRQRANEVPWRRPGQK